MKPEIIKDWNQAETVLGRIAELDRQAESNRVLAEDLIAVTREELKAGNDLLVKQRAPFERDLEAFCRERKADLEPAKSRLLRFGRVGFRDVPKFSWPKKIETLLERLRQLKLQDYIRTIEEPNKQAIMAHHEQLPLGDLGIRRTVIKDLFFIEIKHE